MNATNQKRIWMAVGVLGAAGLYVASHYTTIDELQVLAGIVLGWLGIKRPGDSAQ